MDIEKIPFGTLPDGIPVFLFTLKNIAGVEVCITNYGGAIVSILTPDRQGMSGDVVLGYDTLDGYLNDTSYFGSIIGRYANRIAQGRFTLQGIPYILAKNNGENHLHGGLKGFHKVVWEAHARLSEDGAALDLTYLSKDGEEGYPGNLRVKVIYTLSRNDALKIEYHAETDRPTIINLTNHAYFNLAGSKDILGHEICLHADVFLPVDDTLIPTGEMRLVQGTPMDFTHPTPVGARIGEFYDQLICVGGYDHTWMAKGHDGSLKLAAQVYEPISGRVLEVSTTEPGIQFYSGNFLDGIAGKKGRIYKKCSGLCLEAQHFPDSPNRPEFPSTTLSPGQTYTQTTRYRFSVR